MKVLGIIAEYNPFHKGHLYHIEEAKALIDPDLTIIVMSGNFVQRGQAAITDKFNRARMAIDAGADLVFELPFAYATDSAEGFAYGSVKLLDELGIVTDLVFGSETGDIQSLNKAGRLLSEEPDDFKSLLQKHLNSGVSFPKARSKALEEYGIEHFSSNDILGVEYMKALYKLSSSITPHVIKRQGSNYNDQSLSTTYSSATSIRKAYFQDGIASIKDDLPTTSYDILTSSSILDQIAFENALLFHLRTMSQEELINIYGMNEGLENRIEKALRQVTSYEDFIDFLKSKRYTRTKIQRLLIHCFIGLTKDDKNKFDHIRFTPRLLGASKSGLSSIKHMKADIITSPSAIKSLSHQEHTMTRLDIKATDIYTALTSPKQTMGMDYKTRLYIKDE